MFHILIKKEFKITWKSTVKKIWIKRLVLLGQIKLRLRNEEEKNWIVLLQYMCYKTKFLRRTDYWHNSNGISMKKIFVKNDKWPEYPVLSFSPCFFSVRSLSWLLSLRGSWSVSVWFVWWHLWYRKSTYKRSMISLRYS